MEVEKERERAAGPLRSRRWPGRAVVETGFPRESPRHPAAARKEGRLARVEETDPDGRIASIYKQIARKVAVRIAERSKDMTHKFPNIVIKNT